MKRQPVGPGGEQEVASVRDVQRATLARAEAKDVLQLGRLTRSLAAKEGQCRVGGHDRPLIRGEQVTGILRREDQRAVVLADASRQADHEPADRRVFEEETKLVDDQHSAPVLALDARPECLGEEEVDGRDHLVAQLAHAEGDDGRLEVDVRGRAEHVAEAAVDPTVQDDGDPRPVRQAAGDVAKHGSSNLGVRLAHRTLHHRPLGFVESAAKAGAQVDGVGGGRPEPGLVAPIRLPQVEDVERVARSERELDVNTAHLARERAVLVLGIDDKHLNPSTESAHRERREEVGLPRPGVAEDRDVRVHITTLVEWFDQDWGAGGAVGADEEAPWLAEVGMQPGEKRDQRSRVEHALALQAVRAAGLAGEETVELTKSARLQLAEHRASGRLDPPRSDFELGSRGRGQGQVDGHVKSLVLARRKAALEVLGVGKRASEGGV